MIVKTFRNRFKVITLMLMITMAFQGIANASSVRFCACFLQPELLSSKNTGDDIWATKYFLTSIDKLEAISENHNVPTLRREKPHPRGAE